MNRLGKGLRRSGALFMVATAWERIVPAGLGTAERPRHLIGGVAVESLRSLQGGAETGATVVTASS